MEAGSFEKQSIPGIGESLVCNAAAAYEAVIRTLPRCTAALHVDKKMEWAVHANHSNHMDTIE